jgi:hypothetical protein
VSATHAEMATWTHDQLMTHTNPTGGEAFLAVELAPRVAHVMLEIGLNQDPSLDPSNWDLTDITSSVMYGDAGPGIDYSNGRPDQRQRAVAGRLSAQLLNDSGDFTPRKTTGPHFPYLKAGIPVRLGANLNDGLGYLEIWSGQLAALTPGWDQSGKLPVANLSAGGAWEQLGQGKTPLRSSATRGIASGVQFDGSATPPYRFWPFEDQSGASSAAEYFGGPALTPSGAVTWSSDSTSPGTAPLPTWAAGAGFVVDLSSYTPLTTAQWRLEMAVSIPASHTGDAVVFNWTTVGGTANVWKLKWIDSTHLIKLQCFNSAGTELLSAAGALVNGFDGVVLIDVSVIAVPATGQMAWLCSVGVPAASGGGAFLDSGLVAAFTVGKLNVGRFNAPAQLDGMAFGMFAAFATSDIYDASIANFFPNDYQYMDAYKFEGVKDRLTRICAEQNIKLTTGYLDKFRSMGTQPIDTIVNVLQQCETVDGGSLVDSVNFGLRMFPSHLRHNATQDLALTADQLCDPPNPTEDNAQLRNDVTASLTSSTAGAGARFVQPTGEPYSPDGPGGIGTYDDSLQVNLNAGTPFLRNYASWAVHLGCVDEDRYPVLALDMAALAARGDGAVLTTWRQTNIGARVGITTMPTEASETLPDLFVEDQAGTITPLDWTVRSNCSPARPWDAGIVDADRVDAPTGGSLLVVATTAGAGSIMVDTVAGRLWTTTSADYPYDLSVGRVKLTATACASVVSDPFTRSGSNGFGTAPTGQVYSVNGTASEYSQTGTKGRMALVNVNDLHQAVLPIGSANARIRAKVTIPVVPTGAGINARLAGRYTNTSNYYEAQLDISTAAVVTLTIRARVAGAGSALSGTATLRLAHGAGDTWFLDFALVGTELAAKAWKPASESEPEFWLVTASDDSLTTGSSIVLEARRETGNTNGTVNIDWDDLEVVNPQTFTISPTVGQVIPAGSEVRLWTPATVVMGGIAA